MSIRRRLKYITLFKNTTSITLTTPKIFYDSNQTFILPFVEALQTVAMELSDDTAFSALFGNNFNIITSKEAEIRDIYLGFSDIALINFIDNSATVSFVMTVYLERENEAAVCVLAIRNSTDSLENIFKTEFHSLSVEGLAEEFRSEISIFINTRDGFISKEPMHLPTTRNVIKRKLQKYNVFTHAYLRYGKCLYKTIRRT